MRQIILVGIGILLVVGAFFGAKMIIANKNRPKPKVEKVVKSVFVETVTNATVPIVIPANGTLTAKNRLEIFAETQGVFRSSAHDFKAGQEYRKGQILLSLDSAEYYASVQAAKSEFKNLIASLMPDLRLDYPESFPAWERYLKSINVDKPLPESPQITSENVEYFITGRGVQTSYFNIKNLEQRLGKFRITAPFNGILTEALVTKGTLIRTGQKLGEFIDPTVYEVALAVEKEFSDLLKEGEEVTFASIDSAKEYTGKVSRINARIDQATQTVKVFAAVKGEGLKEGMYLEAQLEARDEVDAIKILRKLLINESQIFVVKDTVLDLINVTPVYFSSKEVVLKGVPNGTKILSKSIPGA
ncbi:MAG: multidrug efflux pump subunit AcrA (membrane-fusion protein), partial [Patiriisocius sp.]